MEFNIFLIYTVLLIIFSFLLLLGKIGEGNILSSLWNSVQQAVLPAGLVAGIIYSITTDVSIIYADGSHEEKNVLFSCDVRDQNGFPQKLSGLGFSNKYIYNGTPYTLVEYPVYYGDNDIVHDTKETLLLMPGSLIKTSNNPDFYFEEPDYINVKKDIFETIYDFFVGSNEERWIIGYAQ